MDNFNNSQEMDWNSEIENEGQEFILLPEGIYDFTITGFERGRYNGGANIPACNKAVLTLAIHSDKGDVSVKTSILLARSLEWKICQFFTCIGLKKRGEKLTMDWTKVPGAKGKAKVRVRTYINQHGEERRINDIESFMEPSAEPSLSDDGDLDEDAPF